MARAYWRAKGQGQKRVLIGRDTRASGPALEAALAAGLESGGSDVLLGGVLPTPAVALLAENGGAVVSASHNPAEYNGVKFFRGGWKLEDAEEEAVEALLDAEPVAAGKVREATGLPARYVDIVCERFGAPLQGLRVVLDCANGAMSEVGPAAFERLGASVSGIGDAPDGANINDGCGATDLRLLSRVVPEEGADLGVAFDGDGDRFGVVDEKGDVIWPDRYMILLARQVLERVPGGKVVFDVKCTQALEDDIRAHGGVPIMWKTGHSHIKKKLQEEKAALAGEMSGHVFFVENYYGFDDGIYGGLRFVEYVAARNEPLSKIMAGTPSYLSTPAINVKCADEVKYGVVERLTADLKRDFGRVVDINGARVVFDDGWGLVRASSNLPELVLRFEAKTPERLNELKKVFRSYLEKYPEIDRHWENE
jgi:phosphomannomutase/phosphoglucomutase